MAELLVKAVSVSHPAHPDADAMAYKRGMPVCVQPDGHPWGARERLPRFVVIKVPGIAVERVRKYIEEWTTTDMEGVRRHVRRRIWRIRWDDLPTRARNRLRDDGELIIKAGDRDVPEFDYTWTQVKGFLRNDRDNVYEAEDLDG